MSVSHPEPRDALRPVFGDAALTDTGRPQSFFAGTARRVLRTPKGLLGAVILAILFMVALFAPVLAPYDPLLQQLRMTLAPPSAQHPFGNDEFGRDLLSRVIVGARLSILVGVIPPLVAALIGVPLGLLAGYRTHMLSIAILRASDVVLAFPGILIAITLAALIGPGLLTIGIGITVFLIPGFIRIVYGEVLSLREREYVLAAVVIGASHRRILLAHLLPNVFGPIFVQLTLNMAVAVLSAASLSYLGLGPQPPTPEWGAMISSGQQYMRNTPHVVTFPGLAILLLVLGFGLLGDALRDALDPVLRRTG